MQVEEALKLVNALVFAKTRDYLSNAQEAVFSGSWQGQTYQEIAEARNFSSAYLNQEVGPELWRLISEACGEKVSKKNLHSVLERKGTTRIGDRVSNTDVTTLKAVIQPLLEEPQPSLEVVEPTSVDNLNSILDRIASGSFTEADTTALRQLLNAGNRQTTLQTGKYNVNIGQGSDIHVGDRTYIDSSNEAMQSLIRAIQKPSTVVSQFQSLIQDKTESFVGREYVFDAIQTFINENSKGYFFITGDPGMGKSTLLAKYVQNTGCIAHFNVQLQGPNRADQFLESVCKQLVERYQLPYDPLPSNATRDGEFLGQLLDEIAQKRNGKPVVIAVDALDEVDSTSYRDANILYLPPYLPDGVYFLLTQRRGVHMPLMTFVPMRFLNLLDYHTETQRDVRMYIQNQIDRSEKLRQRINERQETIAQFTEKIVEKSENNFMYLRYVLQDIEKGLYQDLSHESFPKGLQGYYEFHWRRMGMTDNPLPDAKIKIVYILGEVRQPVSRQQICEFSGEDTRTVQTVLNEWGEFLHEQLKDEQKRYRVYHASFQDFLHHKDILEKTGVTIPAIHQLIAKNQLNKWKRRHCEQI